MLKIDIIPRHKLTSDQCKECCLQEEYMKRWKKPFGDYFVCSCYGTRNMGYRIRRLTELENWFDVMCSDCSKEKQCCRTCGFEFAHCPRDN